MYVCRRGSVLISNLILRILWNSFNFKAIFSFSRSYCNCVGTKFCQESAKSRDTVGNYRYQVGLNHQLCSKLRIVTLNSFLFLLQTKESSFTQHLFLKRSACSTNYIFFQWSRKINISSIFDGTASEIIYFFFGAMHQRENCKTETKNM